MNKDGSCADCSNDGVGGIANCFRCGLDSTASGALKCLTC